MKNRILLETYIAMKESIKSRFYDLDFEKFYCIIPLQGIQNEVLQ